MMLNTPKNFTIAIENIAKEKKITHMEAVLWYCDKEGIEPDAVGYLISKGLKQKIEANARDLNFLPNKHNYQFNENILSIRSTNRSC